MKQILPMFLIVFGTPAYAQSMAQSVLPSDPRWAEDVKNTINCLKQEVAALPSCNPINCSFNDARLEAIIAPREALGITKDTLLDDEVARGQSLPISEKQLNDLRHQVATVLTVELKDDGPHFLRMPPNYFGFFSTCELKLQNYDSEEQCLLTSKQAADLAAAEEKIININLRSIAGGGFPANSTRDPGLDNVFDSACVGVSAGNDLR